MANVERQRLGRTEARDVILRAAAKVFNREGRGLTIDAIASEAGYSSSALYKHFSNKEAILNALWRRVGEMTIEIVESRPPVELPFVGLLKWVLYQVVEFSEQEQELFLAAMGSVPLSGSLQDIDRNLLEMHERILAAFVDLMEIGIADGTLEPIDDPEFYALALGGHLDALSKQRRLTPQCDFKPQIDRAIEHFLHGAARDGSGSSP